jgi:hypothetical protein
MAVRHLPKLADLRDRFEQLFRQYIDTVVAEQAPEMKEWYESVLVNV